jgi:chitosanase
MIHYVRHRERLLTAALCLIVAGVLIAVTAGDAGNPPWPAASKGTSDVTMTGDQRRVADELVNVFEYGTTTARYDAVADLRDGRGYTCGKIGFTTSGTEVRDIVQAYLARTPDDPLRRYLPRLRDLAAAGSADTAQLSGFPADWRRAADNEAFRAVQDAAADRLTFDPALATARRLGIRTPLGVAILLDTAVQHGTGDDPDGMPHLIARTRQAEHGEPATGVPEKAWLLAFLRIRADDLSHPYDTGSASAWSQSVDRVDALRRLVTADRYRLAPPLEVSVFGDRYLLR